MKKAIIFSLNGGVKKHYDLIQKWVADNFETWAHIDETVYFVEYNENYSSVLIRDSLQKLPVPWDKIIVTNWSHDSAWSGMTGEISNWLKSAK